MAPQVLQALSITIYNFPLRVGSSDFEGLQPINVLSNPSSPPTNVRLFTANDELTLEYEDRVLLRFTPSSSDFISFVADRFEYIRDTAIVNIIDNDRTYGFWVHLLPLTFILILYLQHWRLTLKSLT